MLPSRRAPRMWLAAAAACAANLVVTCLAAAAPPTAATTAMLEALDKVSTEEEATKMLEPQMAELKKLDPLVMERVVMRQWWNLARDIVAKSHTQQVDLSFSVRKAVRALKDEADELLRTLNPKYGQAQQVSPAFQWAQNDTCIFLTIKYTVRWNAPGALEVTEPSVNMTLNSFNFSGLGKHSNNKYRYTLNLFMFDNILPDQSTWSAASVGKLSVTMRKKWARKWPRLLADKKLKIGNMHVWMEMQDKLDGTLGGMTSVSNSPITCSASDKLYCLATDTCKKPANCTQCPGKTTPKPEHHVCAGVPTEKGGVHFKDEDMDQNEIGGEIKIYKAKNEFDIDKYVVFWGKDDKNKLEKDGVPMEVGQASPTGSDTEVKLPMNSAIPDGATHLLVYSRNEYGEYATPGHTIITDAVLPKAKPLSISFEDDDGDKGHISGNAHITGPESQSQIEDFALHWGRTPSRKIASGSLVRNVPVKDKTAGSVTTHYFSKNTRIPDGASYLLAFSKNSHGENPDGVSVKIVDKVKPCINKTDADCPQGVDAITKEDGTIQVAVRPAAQEASIETYTLHWGRRDCSDGGQSGAKNGHIKDIKVGEELTVILPADTVVPPGTTHVLAFSRSGLGESNHCVSTSFAQAKDKKEL